MRVVTAVLVLAASILPSTLALGQTPSAATAPAANAPTSGSRKTDAQPLTVDADKMERFGKQGLVIFSGNVVARQNNSVQYADRVEVYLDEKGDRVQRTVSTGNVRVVTRDCRTATAQRAEYFDLEQRVTLIGNARAWQDDNVVSGDTITIFLSQDRSLVEGGKQERVKAVFFPRDDEKRETSQPARRPTEPCKN
ncbi:MAG: lipopolysaccharide transport periplasmic protein LptA [Candidatus Rokuibacteriota bacterium]|nr:MAG: lipopolysaccharide transport periplasmic protein LptA [Candidatus Rokubacteria bacterium]